MNESPLLDPCVLQSVPSNRSPDCSKCASLNAKVYELERRLYETSSRLESFEREVLTVMKGIASDIHAIKRDNERPSNRSLSLNPEDVVLRAECPSSGDLDRGNSESTREALAGACVALETLISEARTRVRPSYFPS